MKILQLTQKYFGMMGVKSIKSVETRPLNHRTASVILIWVLSTISSFMYLFYFASNFEEYTRSVTTISVLAVGTFIFLISIFWNRSKILKLIETLESIVQSSEQIPNKLLIQKFLSNI